ncbi:hypothetical protein RR48_05832 [Papilio machaon]|uniref:Cuticular protein n=1 Tax=Papilio machaon TaxID=76193 RepID=A0A0N1PH21_PAPMA|nr:hypothetical protein RR48_05832 [Papilio machaon]
MAKWSIVALALIGCAVAEPPVGDSYSAPSALVYSSSSHGSPLSSGGHYTSVPVGHQDTEGYHIDPHLLGKIKHIILKDEIQNQAYQSASSGHGISGHGLSSHYGAPAPVYGVPYERIVGIELDNIQQGIQVAQYHQAQEDYSGGYAGGYSGGYSSGGYSSGGYSSGGHGYSGGSLSYSAPSVSYTTIGAPSGSYGVPSPSSSYGAPHH